MAATQKLISVEDDQQVVAIQEKLEVSGSFGDIYKGHYILVDNSDPEYVCEVVAKRNKSPRKKRSKVQEQEEVPSAYN